MGQSDVDAVAQRLESRLAASQWTPLPPAAPSVSTAAEVADFALMLSGKRKQARRGGRLGRLIAHFALAACIALASVAAACDKPDASGDETAEVIRTLPTTSGSEATLTAQPRAGPAWFTDLVLVDAGTDERPWAVLVPKQGDETPVLVDRVGAGLDTVGTVYKVAGQPVNVGSRDGRAQFLDPLTPAESNDTDAAAAQRGTSFNERWQQDERYLATTRAIQGKPTLLDAAYNAEAAATAGGTHNYANGVVLRVDDSKPVLTVIDKTLLESGLPTRYEDLVYVAIPNGKQSLYEPGKVVNLNNVVMERKQTDVNGQPTTVYVANAALDGAEVAAAGDINLQNLLQPRLQRVDQDLVTQAQEVGGQAAPAATPQATATAGTGAVVQQPVVVQSYRGPSFVDDFLIWMWLTNSGFYRGPTVIVNNPPGYSGRPTGDYYYSSGPSGGGSSPSSPAAAQAASRSTALQAARSSVSGQSAGTGGGVAATNKSAVDATARVSAATSKGASVAGDVSSASTGKSISSAPAAGSSAASRSAGSTSAGSRGSLGSSSSSSSSGVRSSGSSSSSSGSKGIGGSSGGFGGGGSSSSSSS